MMNIQERFSLKAFNTFGIEAFAEYFAEAFTREELLIFLREKLPSLPHPLLLLGGGSNILFTGDFRGSVLKISTAGISLLEENDQEVVLKAEAGENWEKFVDYCVERGWGGLENLSLIPGNAGSCPIQNIGAYGSEVRDCFQSLEALNLESLEIKTFSKEDCKFGYRTSVFKHELRGKFLILSVSFRLSKHPKVNAAYGAIQSELTESGITDPGISDIAQAVKRIRRSKLPDPKELGNAGSFFKNPVVSAFEYFGLKNQFSDIVAFNQNDGTYKLAAGWMIEKCGWKGFRKGDAGVHSLQALILVNYGKATGREIMDLGQDIISSVQKKFGVILLPEVNVIGSR